MESHCQLDINLKSPISQDDIGVGSFTGSLSQNLILSLPKDLPFSKRLLQKKVPPSCF
jgi:hypothetical protein